MRTILDLVGLFRIDAIHLCMWDLFGCYVCLYQLLKQYCLNLFRKRLQLNSTQTLFLIVNQKNVFCSSTPLGEIYAAEKDNDAFLYVVYASQEVFGWTSYNLPLQKMKILTAMLLCKCFCEKWSWSSTGGNTIFSKFWISVCCFVRYLTPFNFRPL